MHAKALVVVLMLCVPLVRAAELVTDENVRLQVLSVLFPKLAIKEIAGKQIDGSSTIDGIKFPDALRDEKVYEIEGPPMNEIEACAASYTTDPPDRVGHHRELRFKLFEVRAANQRKNIAVVQYSFADASPPGSCPSIALIVLLTNMGSTWTTEAQFIPDTTHHSGWQMISFADLYGDGIEELLAASDAGGAGYYASALSVFSVATNKLRELASVPTLVISNVDEEERSAAVLDVKRTILEHGQRFCFVQTMYVSKGKRLQPPRVTHPCYAPGAEPQRH